MKALVMGINYGTIENEGRDNTSWAKVVTVETEVQDRNGFYGIEPIETSLNADNDNFLAKRLQAELKKINAKMPYPVEFTVELISKRNEKRKLVHVPRIIDFKLGA